MKSNKFRKVFSGIFILIYLLTAPGMLVTPARAEIIKIDVNGTTKNLHDDGISTINASGSDTGKVKALMVNNGGSVTNQNGDTLTITSTNTNTGSNSRADGVVLWNDSSANPGTNANLYGVTEITSTGFSARGIDVWDQSEATIKGNGTAGINANASGNIGEAYGI